MVGWAGCLDTMIVLSTMNVVVEMIDNYDAQGFGGWWNIYTP